jgi:hypothetical protein
MGDIHNNTPGKHQACEPDRRTCHFQNNVARYLQQRIGNEEHCQSDIVLVPNEVEIRSHSGHLRIPDWRAVSDAVEPPL